MKKKSAPVVLFILLVFVILAAAIIFFFFKQGTASKKHIDPEEYFGTPEGDGALIISEQGNSGASSVNDGRTYIDYDTVRGYINDKFYYDEVGRLIVTTPNEKKVYETGDDSGNVRMIGDSLYISLDCVKNNSDIEIKEFDSPKRLVIKTDFDLHRVIITGDSVIRNEPGERSPVIKEVTPEDVVWYTGDEDGYIKVISEDGFAGYMKSGPEVRIGEIPEHDSLIGEYTSLSFDKKINMVFHQADSQAANNALLQSLEGVRGVNVIAPTWFYFNSTSGELENISSKDYVDTAHDEGYKVFAVINDFDGELSSDSDTLETLKNTPARERIISTLTDSCAECGIDGINVDLENVNEECAPHYIEFIRELSVECRNNGLYLSVDTYVPQEYNSFYNREALAEVADYLVTMAYDEHHPGSKEAGSVSSISWVEEALKDAGDTVPEEKTIIALPFYTRLWETASDGALKSTAMGMRQAEDYVTEHSMLTEWDKTTMQNYASQKNTDILYEIWLEDEESLAAKMDVINNYDIAGVAEWKLGLEKQDIWAIIGEKLNK